jgi:hypothetical protein
MNVAVIISTHNRVDDARINMEIIREVWKKASLFGEVKIIHSYNGKKEWYPEAYLENLLVRTENRGHFQGAADLLDQGFMKIKEQDWNIDYVIFLAADTWLTKPDFIEQIINEMKLKNLSLATNMWDALPNKTVKSLKTMAVDFFILDYNLALKWNIFPLHFEVFRNKYKDLFSYQGKRIMLEKYFIGRFVRAVQEESNYEFEPSTITSRNVKIIAEREPVHERVDENGQWVRKMYWPQIGLITNHDPSEKKMILKNLGLEVGPSCKKLIHSQNLDYYNHC